MRRRSDNRSTARGLLVALMLFWVGSGCDGAADVSPNAGLPIWDRPAGVPEAALWYTINDSVFWYEAHDSLGLAQMRPETTPAHKTASLFALRDLGWRMKVDRGPALQRPGDEQALDQQVFMLERQADAVPLSGDPRFEDLYRRTAADALPALAGVLPGLRQYAGGSVLYFWPASLAIVWSPLFTALQADSLLDSLGCITLTNPQLTYQYYVQRGWAVALPAGADLFGWLRLFNADPRVVLAHPVSVIRDPPSADYRLIRRLGGKPLDSPRDFYKLSEKLKNAYYSAHFTGSTVHARSSFSLTADGNRFKLQITTIHDDAAADSLMIARLAGEVVKTSKSRVVAWIPYSRIPELAADSTVKKVTETQIGR